MILALDASTSVGSVALVDGAATVRELAVETPRGRGGALFAALENILQDRPPLDRVVVGTGPGSYNGIRSALAVGWGIARAQKIPLVGVSSLLALAEGDYVAVGDARRGQYYMARISRGTFLEEPILVEEASIKLLASSPETVYVPALLGVLPEAEVRTPSAVRLALIGRSRQPGGLPEPLYLKSAHITAPSKNRASLAQSGKKGAGDSPSIP